MTAMNAVMMNAFFDELDSISYYGMEKDAAIFSPATVANMRSAVGNIAGKVKAAPQAVTGMYQRGVKALPGGAQGVLHKAQHTVQHHDPSQLAEHMMHAAHPVETLQHAVHPLQHLAHGAGEMVQSAGPALYDTVGGALHSAVPYVQQFGDVAHSYMPHFSGIFG